MATTYTIYGLLYTTFGLGICHIGQADRPDGRLVGITGLDLEADIRSRLGKLPKGLKDAYDEIYDSIKARSENERQIADRAFQWVACSCIPHSTKALLPAVCQHAKDDTIKPIEDTDEELVLELCHNLLVIDPYRQVRMPSHLSVIE